jgi:hypothetical protein
MFGGEPVIEHRWLRIFLSALMIIVIFVPTGFTRPNRGYDATFGVTLLPSSIALKVGEKANISVTITQPETVDGTQVCYTLDGFPSSGFITSFNPTCSGPSHGYSTILMVEATPAAAPQTVEGYVIASSVGQTAQAVLNLSVQPAMPAWIPWLGLILFFSLLGAAVLWRPKLTRSPRKGRSNKPKKR